MRKVVACALAVLLIVLTCLGGDMYLKEQIRSPENVARAYQLNIDQRNQSRTSLKGLLDDRTVLILGSSELMHPDRIAYPQYLFGNKDSDFKMVLAGREYTQSIHQAMTIGAYGDLLPKKKVVFVLSPQWFTRKGIDSQAYASRFSESIYLQMMRNQNLSRNVKQRITDRLKVLLKSDPKQLTRIQEYEKIYLGNDVNLFARGKLQIYRSFMDIKNNYQLYGQLSKLNLSDCGVVKGAEIDYQSLMKEATAEGERESANNVFGFKASFYDTIKDKLQGKRNEQTKETYTSSPEYEDFRLFLDVCRELRIDPLIVSVPVNGYWYDYTGLPKAEREGYYENIRRICQEYRVELADFSDREYEKYFLEDNAHLGRKGWVYFDQAVYQFYQK